MRPNTAISILSLCAVLAPGTIFGQQVPPEIIDERPGVIEVTASATVQYEPDRAYISFAVTSFAETAAAATEASAVKMTGIGEALDRVGIGDGSVRTTAFRLDPHYASDPDTHQRQPQPDGYTAFNVIGVKLDEVERAGEVIDAVIGAGADNVSNLRFGLEDMTPVYHEALAAAYHNASAQAAVLAMAAGKSLGRLLSIRTPQQFYAGQAVELQSAVSRGTPTPIDPGTLSYSTSIHVEFEIR